MDHMRVGVMTCYMMQACLRRQYGTLSCFRRMWTCAVFCFREKLFHLDITSSNWPPKPSMVISVNKLGNSNVGLIFVTCFAVLFIIKVSKH